MRDPDRVVTLAERLRDALVETEMARQRAREAVAYRAWRSYFLGVLSGLVLAVVILALGS